MCVATAITTLPTHTHTPHTHTHTHHTHTDTHTHTTQTHTQTHTHTHMHTDTHPHTQRDTHTHTHAYRHTHTRERHTQTTHIPQSLKSSSTDTQTNTSTDVKLFSLFASLEELQFFSMFLSNRNISTYPLYTLTGHFIRYILLVPGWTPFSFRTLNSSCHRFNKVLKHCSEILVHINMIASHSCCRFVVCTSMMRISRSSTSQRCSIGLRSGDCGGHLSKVNSLSCSRNQSEMI